MTKLNQLIQEAKQEIERHDEEGISINGGSQNTVLILKLLVELNKKVK